MNKYSMARSGKFLVLIAAMAFGTSNAALAAGDRPCAEDVQKFCKDMDKKDIAQCMKEHVDELSPACKESRAEAKQKMQGFSQACKSDVSKLCADMRPGGGRIVQCLKEHESELSAECQEALSSAK